LGHQITTFEVKKAGFEFPNIFGLAASDYLLIGLFVILILLLIIYLSRRGRAKSKYIKLVPARGGAKMEE
jgi:hypothetical protein